MHVPVSTGKFRLFGSPVTNKSAPGQESVFKDVLHDRFLAGDAGDDLAVAGCCCRQKRGGKGIGTHQALSERFALPTYAKHLSGEFVASEGRMNITLLCMSTPGRTDLQSRRSSRGKLAACHHLDWKQIVPAPCVF